MGDNRILDVQEHIKTLIKQVNDPKDSEHIHTLCHALEVLLQCEHMGKAIGSIKDVDFPNTFDFD